MSEQKPYQRHEKDEKEDEKQNEKQNEKSWDEKWRRDPLNAILWAAVLIWAGLVLLGDTTGYLSTLGFASENTWALIFLGAGVIVLIGVVIRLIVPAYRRAVTGSAIWGLILLGIGFGAIYGAGIVWAFVVIGIGVAILIGGLTRRRPS